MKGLTLVLSLFVVAFLFVANGFPIDDSSVLTTTEDGEYDDEYYDSEEYEDDEEYDEYELDDSELYNEEEIKDSEQNEQDQEASSASTRRKRDVEDQEEDEEDDAYLPDSNDEHGDDLTQGGENQGQEDEEVDEGELEPEAESCGAEEDDTDVDPGFDTDSNTEGVEQNEDDQVEYYDYPEEEDVAIDYPEEETEVSENPIN